MPRLLLQQLLLLLLLLVISIYGRFDRRPRPRGGGGGLLLLMLVTILLSDHGLLGYTRATPVLLDVGRDGLLDGTDIPVTIGVVRVAAVAVLTAVRVRLLAVGELPLPVAVDEIHQVVVPLRLLHERVPRELARSWPLKREGGIK